MTRRGRYALVGALWLSACSSPLLQKSAPLSVRYFAPLDRSLTRAAPRTDHLKPVELRLGRVLSGAELDLRMIVRRSPHELVYQDALRWAERPVQFLERALIHALFEEYGLTRTWSGTRPALDAELLSFEQTAEGPYARVSVRWALRDEHKERLVDTVAVQRRLAQPAAADPDAFAQAMSEALDEAVDVIVQRVTAALRAPQEPQP